MNINQELLKKNLSGKLIGQQLYYYEEIGSTNDEAFRLGTQGAPEGTVVIAESQSAGRGRLQRVWHSPAASNIYTSVILRPDLEAWQAPQLSIAAGVAVAETLNSFCPGKVVLKWPNDVLLNERKVCGILAQMKISAGGVEFVVLGIGINVNIKREQFPRDILDVATSLREACGREISRTELIISLYENLAKWYKQLLQKGFSPVRGKWLTMTAMIGRDVQVISRDEALSGRALGLADDGSLILLTTGDKEVKISAGDATIIKR